MENKKTKPNNINFKNFWAYALILFSVALILIMVSNVFQDIYYKQITAALSEKQQKELENMSILDSIQKINQEYSKKLDENSKEIDALKSQQALQDSNLKLSEQNMKALTIINDTQALYIKKSYTAAKKKLLEINRDTLPNDILTVYDNIYKLLYK